MADTPTGFARPSFDDLLVRAQSDYTAATGVDVLVRRGIIPEMPYVDARALHDLHAHLDNNALQGHPLYATGDYLDGWARVWGVARRAAVKATGGIDMTGVDGGQVAAGVVLVRGDGARFIVTQGGVIVAGALNVVVTAEIAGLAGDTAPGTVMALESPIATVDSAASVAIPGLTGGADREGNDAFRSRMLDRIQEPTHGGRVADYVAWTLAVPGVTRVWVSPLEMGEGTVVVRFMMDTTYVDGIPLPADVAAVQAAIDRQRPVTAEVLVAAPVAVALPVTVSGLLPNTAAVRTAVAAELADMILRRGAPGVMVRQSWIWEAVSLAAGEDSHVIAAPAADVAYSVGEIPILGAVSYV